MEETCMYQEYLTVSRFQVNKLKQTNFVSVFVLVHLCALVHVCSGPVDHHRFRFWLLLLN